MTRAKESPADKKAREDAIVEQVTRKAQHWQHVFEKRKGKSKTESERADETARRKRNDAVLQAGGEYIGVEQKKKEGLGEYFV